MQYENRQPEEGINVSDVNPVKQMLVLLAGALVLMFAVYFAFLFLGGWLARLVPFSAEVSFIESIDFDIEEFTQPPTDSDGRVLWDQRVNDLNDLAERVMAHMDMPEGMTIDVHYVDEKVFNAFATLGGNVFFYRGLIEKMPHENALAMVMAHEIAHEIHRDPISGLGGGVTAGVMTSMVFGGAGPLGSTLNVTNLVAQANFTRGMETAADKAAIQAVNSLYGHVAGAGSMFEALAAERVSDEGVDIPDWAESFMRTHPLDNDRVEAIENAAKANGWKTEGETTPLAESLQSLVK